MWWRLILQDELSQFVISRPQYVTNIFPIETRAIRLCLCATVAAGCIVLVMYMWPFCTYSCSWLYSVSYVNMWPFCTHSWISISDLCSTLTTIQSGSFDLVSNTTHTRALFTCDIGTTLLGLQEIKCLGDGSWEYVLPSCGKYEENSTYNCR